MPKCPICQVKYKVSGNINSCPICEWDLTKYSLSIQDFSTAQKSKKEWAKTVWNKLQWQKIDSQNKDETIKQLNQEIDRLQLKEKLFDNGFILEDRLFRLKYWLKERQWQYADIETALIMTSQAERIREGFLNQENIKNFPTDVLNRIDQLWIEYSNKRFGFSVQKHIYKNQLQGKTYNPEIWKKFCKRVGWCYDYPDYDVEMYKAFLEERGLPIRQPDRCGWSWGYRNDSKSFNIFAPPGHLPFLRVGGFSDNYYVNKPWGETRVVELLLHDGLDTKDSRYHHYFPGIPGKNIKECLKLTSSEVMLGCKKRMSYLRQETCNYCLGTGATILGCCKACKGKGRKEVPKTIEISIPQNIQNERPIHCRNLGDAGQYGGVAGDLYIYLEIS